MVVTILESALTGNNYQEIARLLILAVLNNCYISIDPNALDAIDENIINTDLYLGKGDRELLKARYCSNISKVIRENTLTCVIGEAAHSATEAYQIIAFPSQLLLENAVNDWAVLKRWAELFIHDRMWRPVFEELNKAIKLGKLQSSHAGGSGDISKLALKFIQDNPGVATEKMLVVFDSDKGDVAIEKAHTKHKGELDVFGIKYHELYKREMENYFPLECFEMAGYFHKDKIKPTISNEEYDFEDIPNLEYINYNKNTLPTLCKYLEKRHLQERLNHQATMVWNNVSVNEVQYVLLLMCKYI